MNDLTSQQLEQSGIKGIYKLTRASLVTPYHWKLHRLIEKFESEKNFKKMMEIVRFLNEKCSVKVYRFENIIPTVGRTLIANNLCNSSPTNDPYINYTSLGTGTTTPANGDTTLVTETYRKTTASATNSSNVGYVTAFYTATETTGTFKEAGLFCNATATANSGVLLSRVLLNPTTGIAKSSTETLTIDYMLTIS